MNVLLKYLNQVTVLLEYIDRIFVKSFRNARIMISSIMLEIILA